MTVQSGSMNGSYRNIGLNKSWQPLYAFGYARSGCRICYA